VKNKKVLLLLIGLLLLLEILSETY